MGRFLRISVVAAIALDIFWRVITPHAHLQRDLYLYNAIWLVALMLILSAPLPFNRIALAALSLAITSWGLGSLAASLAEFYPERFQFTLASQLAYLIFYPLLLIAIPRISSSPAKLESLEVLDAAIFGLGFTSIVTTLLVTIIFPDNSLFTGAHFFYIFYPVGDIALLIVTITHITIKGATRQRLYLLAAIVIFALTDIYYLWLYLEGRYSFAAIADDGWLIAIVLFIFVVQTPSHHDRIQPIHPALTAISIFISPILLATAALRPDLFPIYIVGILIANLLLGFIRMNTALRHARTLVNERLLARTDELTGLANRRRLLAELDNTSTFEGALMLLDLNDFKPINDTHGHQVGDRILQEIARRFNRLISTDSLLARLGGDEFGVIYRGSYYDAIELAYALRASLSYPFSINGLQLSVGVSIGVVENDGKGDLLRRADIAMYQAKQTGMGVIHS